MIDGFEIFDSHLHIIDRRFPLVPNQGYLPEEFTCEDYRARLSNYKLVGGAVVSGSFQAFDQQYLIAALAALGPAFVGVTQLPADTADEEIIRLNDFGVRAVRFNLKRGGSEDVVHLSSMAKRIHELVRWHVELYVDSRDLESLFPVLVELPSISIDHLGLSKIGFQHLLALVERGAKVKATGFGRVDFDVATAIRNIYSANPASLMFGTDLPSTRAPIPYRDEDRRWVIEALGETAAVQVFSENALAFYRPRSIGGDYR